MAGRIKGSKNFRTARDQKTAESILAKFKFHPLEMLMMFAHGDWKGLGYDAECFFHETAEEAVKMGYNITADHRLSAAKDACAYVLSKKQAVEVSGDLEVIQLMINDYTTLPKCKS